MKTILSLLGIALLAAAVLPWDVQATREAEKARIDSMMDTPAYRAAETARMMETDYVVR